MNPIVAANCPSLEQLMGIVDLTDPCQNGTASITGENTPGAASGGFSLSSISPIYLVIGVVVLAAMTHNGKR